MQLIVVGFHRSGTSLLTQLLHAAGLFIGDNLLGALPSNPYGHFEDREVLELHREILADHGQNWQVDLSQEFFISAEHWRRMQDLVRRREVAHRDWGFKEPRSCLMLGAWKFVAPEAKFVIVYRDPSACVRSMMSRQASEYLRDRGPADDHLRFFREPDHGLRLWDTYNRAIGHFARAHIDDCLVLPFSSLTDGHPVVRQVNERFGAHLDEVATETVFDADVTSSENRPIIVRDRELRVRVLNTWHGLEALATETTARVRVNQ